MDFKPMKKDRKAGADGLFGWESPGLRARLEAEKLAAKPKVVEVPRADPTWGDANMQRRDLKLEGLAEPAAKGGCAQCSACFKFGQAFNCLVCAQMNKMIAEIEAYTVPREDVIDGPRAESVCTHRLKYRNWLQKEYCPQCFACEEKLS